MAEQMMPSQEQLTPPATVSHEVKELSHLDQVHYESLIEQVRHSERLLTEFQTRRSVVTKEIRTAELKEQSPQFVNAVGMRPVPVEMGIPSPDGSASLRQTVIMFVEIGEDNNTKFARLEGQNQKNVFTLNENEWKCAIPSVTMEQGNDYSVYAVPRVTNKGNIGTVTLIAI